MAGLDSKQIMEILPHRQPFLLIDTVEELIPGQKAVARKCVSYNEPYFAGHFPNEPVMPGVLIIEAMAQAGAAAIAEKFKARFGKSVSFGIGVNCGNAVVGNIGCDFRMDYTAIGDTVNTAARLESNAKPGQILISADVYEAVKERIAVTPIGEIPLKGKSNGVFVYQVDVVSR